MEDMRKIDYCTKIQINLLKASAFFSYGTKNQSSSAFLISVGEILASAKSHSNYGHFA